MTYAEMSEEDREMVEAHKSGVLFHPVYGTWTVKYGDHDDPISQAMAAARAAGDADTFVLSLFQCSPNLGHWYR